MIRSLFSSLFAPRSHARTRSQVSFRPQLESLEDRLAPSGVGIHAHTNVDINVIAQVQNHVGNNNTENAQIVSQRQGPATT